MKRYLVLFLIIFMTALQSFADDMDGDVIEFHRNEENINQLVPPQDVFEIRVEKNAPPATVVKNIQELGRINIYDQKAYRKYDRGVEDKTYTIDDNLEVIIGSHNLYSAIGPNINFIKRESSYGDYGATVISRNKYVNIAAASYNSSTATGNSGGVIISSAPVKLPVGELIVGSAVYSTNLGIKENTKYGVFNQFRYKRFKFNTQLSKYKPNSSLDVETNTLFLAPEIDLTKNLSLYTGFENNFGGSKNGRTDITLNYHPKKSDRNLELEVTLTNFSQPGNASLQRRMSLSTKFRI